jgi:stage IV sporulation protein FB
MEQNYWQLGRWLRIPVAMHWTVLIAVVWLYLFFWDLLATAIASLAYFALLVAHEFGHVAVLRWRRIAVESIELNGLHGRTSHGWASPGNDILVAWGGVGAQLLVLLLAFAAGASLDMRTLPAVALIAGPLLFVFIKLNVVLMIVALLPLGPFDGHAAWAAIPWLRKRLRARRRRANVVELFPEKKLSPKKRREVEESSTKAAADLLDKVSKKLPNGKDEA